MISRSDPQPRAGLVDFGGRLRLQPDLRSPKLSGQLHVASGLRLVHYLVQYADALTSSAGRPHRLELDVSRLEVPDRSGLRLLVQLGVRLRVRGTRLLLVDAPPTLQSAAARANLHRLLL